MKCYIKLNVLLVLLALCLPTGSGEATDAANSEATGNGLQFATAGILAQFTVTSKDESGVRRTSGGDEWIVEFAGTRSLTGSVVDNLDGTYQVSYTATKSGSYEVSVLLAKSGGLTGSYFENVWFFYTPVQVTVDPQINMDWGLGRITPTGSNYIAIRWVGKLKTLYTETYTFYATTDDGARLWVDNVPLIDRWDSYCNETSATLALSANVFYDFKMEYKQITGSAFARLTWASKSTPREVIPSSQFYYETQAKQSPFSLIVMPNVANGSQSTAVGSGLLVATAGTAAQFTLQANDMYDNERGEGGDIFSVRVYPPNTISNGNQGLPVHAVVVDDTDSSYSVEYTTYTSGMNTLLADLLIRGGVSATYYDNNDFTNPVKFAEGTSTLQNVHFTSSTYISNGVNSIPTVNSFSVRYVGFVKPTKDSTYQFVWNRNVGAASDRVRLWIDNTLIIDQWTSLAASNPSGSIDLRSAYYYDTRLDYMYYDGCVSGSCEASAILQWGPAGSQVADITSSQLYMGYPIMNSPYMVDVLPAGTCSAKSFATPNQAEPGNSLELSTAGVQAEFSITAKDLYGNLRGIGGDNFKVRLTGVDSSAGIVQDFLNGTYRVTYTTTVSGTYDISVVFGASGIYQSPFRMVCQPATRHLQSSLAAGQALSLATAGIKSTVTVTVRDIFDNWQPDPSVANAGIKFQVVDVATLQPIPLVQDALTPADIPRFVDTISYIGPSTNAGHQVSTPTNLDNPNLVLRYTITKSGNYSLLIAGSTLNDGKVYGSPFSLLTDPNIVCASTSTASGQGLSIATAGMSGSFIITARDQYFNFRNSYLSDNFVARVRQFYSSGLPLASNNGGSIMDVIECGWPGSNCKSWNTYSWGWTTTGGRDKQAKVSANGDGTYTVAYNATRSAVNYLWATLAVPGGLQATYYLNDDSFSATGSNRVVQQDQTIDFSITANTPTQLAGQTMWTARWTGLVRPSLSDTYTFYLGDSGTQVDHVKLWVDNSLIIQQWYSLGSETPSGKINLEQDAYYEVLMAAMSNGTALNSTSKFQLQWSANQHAKSIISSSRLYMSYHISDSPFSLNVLPATTCAGNSKVYRPALTLTTAGVMASFTMQSRDAFDNLRTLPVEEFTEIDFNILANASLPIDGSMMNRIQPSSDDGGVLLYSGTVFYIGTGAYQVNYTTMVQGTYNLEGKMMQPGGLFGIYYENEDLTDRPVNTLGLTSSTKPYMRVDSTIDFNWMQGRPVPPPSPDFPKDIGPSYFSVRWMGMVKPMYSEVYTFSLAVDDGAKLWINDLLVMDFWYARCSEVDGTIALMADTLYPIKIEYKQSVGNASIQMYWRSNSQQKMIVPSTSLYRNTTSFNLCNQNQSLIVEPAIVCSTTSTAGGSGLTVATAGQSSFFTIQSRDEYMNNRKLSDAGIRPGNVQFACDDWSQSGVLNPNYISSFTVHEFQLDTPASSVDGYYVGRTITFTAGTGQGQSRIVESYTGSTRTVVVYPPLTVTPDQSTKYMIGNYGGQWSEHCDATKTEAYRLGYPEFRVVINSVTDVQPPYHAPGLVDRLSTDEPVNDGAAIVRLSSIEFPGGLTATYYDNPGVDPGNSLYYNPGFQDPKFSTWCTSAQPCDQTIDFSHVGTGLSKSLKLTYGQYPEAIGNLGFTSGPLAATYYDHPSEGWVVDERLSDSNYGVRWSGYISPTLAGLYTFQANLLGSSYDRVKLWIDNSLVIQQWNSLSSSHVVEGTFQFPLSYPSAYPISIHYKSVDPQAASANGLTIRWKNLAIGSVLSAQIFVSTLSNAFCASDSPLSTTQAQWICLATLDPVTHQLSFKTSFGSPSEQDSSYIGQILQLSTPYLGQENHLIQDYEGVYTGTVRKAGTTNITYLAADASTTDDYYTGHYIEITGGTGVGSFALILRSYGCAQSGCDHRLGTLASATTKYCDCSGVDAQSIVHEPFPVATDTTSKYSIFLYRARLNTEITNHSYKSDLGTFEISSGYTMVTYGQAECAEFTGQAVGGGNSTTSSQSLFTVNSTLYVLDASALFGGVCSTSCNLWASIGDQTNIQVTAISSNTLTVVQGTFSADVSCSVSSPCAVTPRNTMILNAEANTVQDFYTGYYIQILSGACAGQWRMIEKSNYNGYYVTISVSTPWSLTTTSNYLGCTQPDLTSVYYLSKVCIGSQISLQSVGPISSLTIRPGIYGNEILETAQSSLGYSPNTVWGPGYYNQLSTQGDSYPYPYEPYQRACCKAYSGSENDNVYQNMIVVITSGTGRGQRRFITGYDGAKLQATITPEWTTLPDSTSRYSIFTAKSSTSFTQNQSTIAPFSVAPVIPSTRLYPLRSRYEIMYTPTVSGDYQVHASIAQGSGIEATYYDDMDLIQPVSSWNVDNINFDINQIQQGFGNSKPRGFGDLGLSDKQSFSVRWLGLLQIFDSVQDTTPHTFTFQAGIAETDERVKLWVDNSLIIDRWDTYDYLSSTSFSATIGLKSPFYYEVKMEYKQFAGTDAKASLQWQCGNISNQFESPCPYMSLIPSSNLFQIREISGSPFPPFEILPASTCAAKSSVRGSALSVATAGVSDSFTIQSNDEYDNERAVGGDLYVVRAIPYDTWTSIEGISSNPSMDCIYCPPTIHGAVNDTGDSSYVAKFNGTKKGSYKVLTSLALSGGMSATYYSDDQLSVSRFHRTNQVGNSEMDFAVPCVFRNNYVTANVAGYTQFDSTTAKWRGFVGEASTMTNVGVWRGQYQCQNWISGTAMSGFCAVDSMTTMNSQNNFANCEKVTSTAETAQGNVSQTSIQLEATGVSQGVGDNYFVGMIIYIESASSNAGVWSIVSSYSSVSHTATVNFQKLPSGTVKYFIFNCGANFLATTMTSCMQLSTILQPLAWIPSSSSIIILDQASSSIDGAYDGWDIKIVNGACKGQVRKINNFVGRMRLAVVSLPWSTSSGKEIGSNGQLEEYYGCVYPDSTSEYILYSQNLAPGSIDASSPAFGVRWAGFVKPSTTTEYTFQALLSASQGYPNQERVKLWVDNNLIIDQWSSLASTSASGTFAFADLDVLYDIQLEYKRSNASSVTNTPTEGSPAGNFAPYISLRWQNTLSGSDATLSEAYSYQNIVPVRLFSNFPVPNDETLEVVVADTCATTCIVSGNGLTASTAGVQASFVIRARDAFANDRQLDEDSFEVHVIGPSNFSINVLPTASVELPGDYSVLYTATVSGIYEVSIRRFNIGGLLGEYFNNMWLIGDPSVANIDPDVNFNWETFQIAPLGFNNTTFLGSEYMSVRWTGAFKPELSELYTFSVSADNGIRFYLDSALVVDNWEANAASVYSATLSTVAGLLYDIKLEYRHSTGNANVSLMYTSPSIAQRTIPSSRLFNSPAHVFGSPFTSYVSPADTCGSTSFAFGSGLSYTTAGQFSAFTIQALDEYMNYRTKWEDTFVVKTMYPSNTMSREVAGTVGANVMKGKYNVAYMVTKAGSMNIYASLVVPNGLVATYYDGIASTFYDASMGNYYGSYNNPVKSRVENDINLENFYSVIGGGTCACDAAGATSGTPSNGASSCLCNATSLTALNGFAVRYSGFFRPSTASTYTFSVLDQSTSTVDRVKLWLDGVLVIDQWNSLDTTQPTATFSFPVTMDYYEILMEFSSYNGTDSRLRLQTEQADVQVSQSLKLVQPSYLAQSVQVEGSPFNLVVSTDVTDFSNSMIFGSGLTIATAGFQGSFQIQSVDQWGNNRTDGGDVFSVHVSSAAGINLEGNYSDNLDGTYTANYLPTLQGVYSLYTVLGAIQKTSTLLVEPGTICATNCLVNGVALTIGTAGYAATFTIQAKDSFLNIRTVGDNDFVMRLIGLNNELHNNPFHYIGVEPNTDLGRYITSYRTTQSGTFSLDVRVAGNNGLQGKYYRDTQLSNLAVEQNDTSIDFNWGIDGPYPSSGITDHFSIQWTGYLKAKYSEEFTFETSMGGNDERVKLWVDSSWIIDQWNSLSASSPSGTVWLVSNTLYDIKLQYADGADSAQVQLLWSSASQGQEVVNTSNLFVDASPVAGSPFATTVYPALTSGTLSTASGQGLSLATAGVSASLTIQAKDNLGNLKTTSDDVFVVRVRHNTDYTRSNILGTVTALGSGTYAASYTATWKRNGLSCVTNSTTYACTEPVDLIAIGSSTNTGIYDVSTWINAIRQTTSNVVGPSANRIGVLQKYHDILVSQALPGGLFATYYTDMSATPLPYSGDFDSSVYRTKIVQTVNQDFLVSDPLTSGCLDAIDTAFGVRYVGFFSPPTAATYTFAIQMHNENERVKLWMNNLLIIDQWNSLSYAYTPSGTINFAQDNAYYDMKIEYKQYGGSADEASISFQYAYPDDTTLSVVPSTRLWQSYDLAFHIYDEGGLTATYYNSLPSGTNEVVGLSTADKAVQESTVDWSGTSSTDRPYPSSITSGTFSVRWIGFVQPSRSDLYTFYTPIHGGTQTSTDERVRLWIDNSLVISQWESLSSIDPSGTYQFAQPNEFYNLMMDYKVSSSTAPRSIALQWENAGAQYLLSDNSPAIPGSTVSRGVIPPNRLFRIRTSSTIERDDFKAWDLDFFQSGVSTLEDRQQETPGQWAKISACPEWSDTGDNVRYNRCRGKGLRTNEVLRVDVKPAVVCASQTTISDVGGSLSLSTAGVTRTFTLTARDAYDNQRDSTDDAFIARATLSDSSVYGSSVAPFYGSLVPQDWATLQAEGQNNPVWNQYGKYEISYLITQSASFFMTVMSADVQGNGLLGTYFSTTSLSGIIYTQVDPNIDFNWGQTNPTTDPNILVGSFSARWTGYIKMNNTETYTFTTNCDYGVSLQVGSIQVISQWGSNASYYSGVFTATSGVLYDFIFEYKTQGPISFCTLSYSSPSTPQQTVPTSQFFVEAQTVNGGEVPLDTLPTLISATASTINGTGLSLATAGVTASFTVIAKDMYGNVRDSCADILFARMYPDPPTCLQGQYPYDWATWSMGTFFTCTSIGKISLATTDTSLMTNQINTNTNAGPIGTNGSYGFYMPVPSNTGSSWSDVSSVCTSDRFTGNKHPFTYVQTRAGSSTLYVSETPGGIGSSYAAAAGRGLMATYYETPDFGNPQFAQDCITQDGTPYENAYCNVGTINISYSNMMTPGSLTNDGAFSVRWLGFIRMSTTNQNGQTWTFSTPLGQGTYNDERVKLWIDNSLLIDEWTSLSTTNPTSTVPYDYFSDKQLYDIKVEYKNVFGGPTDGSYLQLKLGDVLVPSDSLYVNHLIEGIASRITVLPNVAFHRECEVYGDGLTIATAGVQATFAIQSKDAYNNQRGVGGDLFIVRAFSDGCQTIDNTIEQKATCQPYGPAIKTCGGTNDPVCSHLTNPAPQMNDGGDGDGMNWAGALSVKDGGKFRTDVEGVCPTCPRLIRANVVDNQDSTYTAYFTGTQKGRYTVVTSLVNSGGLLATYYDGDPVQSTTVYSYSDYGISVRVDPLVDWSAAQAGNKAIASLTSSTWGVRWVGFVRPSLANQYTFQVSIGESTERVKLWVDNSIIIQQWTSIDGTTVSGTMGFGNGNGYYDISLLYKCATSSGQCAYNLKWESTPTGNANNDVSLGTIPSDRLFQRYDVPNTGLTCTGTPCITKDWSDNTTQTTLEIFPSVTCASLSVAHGNGLTLTTVGVPATFTIQAKDAYSNSREDTDASFTVDLFGSGGSVIYNGAVYNGWYGAGNYTASYTAVDANNYNLYVRYGAYNILGSPFSTTIKPGNACGAQSTIQGSGLTAATISPAKSVFTIQARDQYGNAKTQALPTDQDFIVRVVRTSGAGMQGTNGLPPFYDATAISSSPTLHATFNTPTDDGRYAGYYQVPSTPSPSGYIHYLYASWIAQGGIAATYYAGTPSSSNGYSSLALSAPINVLTNGNAVNQRLTELGGTVEDSSQAASTLWGSSALTSSTEGYVIRWSGMYQTLTSQRYFQWKVTTDNGDRVRLWIDNKLIIDQWTSLDSNTPSGGYIFDSVDGIYDVTAEYWRADGKPTTPANIEVLDGSSTAAFSSIPSTRLYFTQDLSGSPYAVTVTV